MPRDRTRSTSAGQRRRARDRRGRTPPRRPARRRRCPWRGAGQRVPDAATPAPGNRRTVPFAAPGEDPAIHRRNRHHRLVRETDGTEGVLKRLQIDEHPERANRPAAVIARRDTRSRHSAPACAVTIGTSVRSPRRSTSAAHSTVVERRLAGIECRDLPAIRRRELHAQDGSTTVHRARKDAASPGGIKGAHDGNRATSVAPDRPVRQRRDR